MASTRQLILAEKPAVARDLARVLNVPTSGDGCFQNDRYVITWCIGHLVELDEPADYNPDWKRWSLDTLPMLPERFGLHESRRTAGQWRVVRDLLRRRDFGSVVNACDAGREGELIFRYCYDLAGSRLPILRLWISSLTEQAITKGFGQLRSGAQLEPLYAAARSRSEADWLVGMNATRAVTLWRRGQTDVLCSLGRVQTPTLGLLTARENAILRFVPRDYFEVQADLTPAGSTQTFQATWQHEKQRRLATVTLAQALCNRDQPAPVQVETVEQKTVREPPPLLFDLTSLQRTCNRRFGWSAQRTLSLAQSLYEQHKLLTYPRTDSRYLSQDLIPQLPKTFAALGQCPAYAPFCAQLGRVTPPRRVFQDAKVRDHHAIIPTPIAHTPARLQALPSDERKMLDLVARRFLGAFFPDAEFLQTQVVVRVEAQPGPPVAAVSPSSASSGAAGEPPLLGHLPSPPDRYYAKGRVRAQAGWQEVAGLSAEVAQGGKRSDASGDSAAKTRRGSAAKAGAAPPDEAATDDQEESGEEVQDLPPLRVGQVLKARFAVQKKTTQPPHRYSEATLLSAMESAGKHLDDEALRDAMKDAGLGTPATRASIIETLLDRGYITRTGKQLRPTALGLDLIDKLPEPLLGSAQLTGEWEARLARIARGEESRQAFMADIAKYVQGLVDTVRGSAPPPAVMSGVAAPPGKTRGSRGQSSRRTVRRGAVTGSAGLATDDAAPLTARKRAGTRKGATVRKAAAPGTRSSARKTTKPSSISTPWLGPTATVDVQTQLPEAAPAPKRRRSSAVKPATPKATPPAAKKRRTTSAQAPASRPEPPLPRWEPPPLEPMASPRRLALSNQMSPAPLRRPEPSQEVELPPAGLSQQPLLPIAPPPARGADYGRPGTPVLPPLHCPRCQAGQLLWGKAAWGCSNYRSCPLVIPFVLQGQRLSERDLRNLLERGETLPMMLSGPGGELRAKLVLRTAGERTQSGTTSFVQVIAAPAPSR